MQSVQPDVDSSLEAATLRDPRAMQRLVTDQAAELRLLRQRVATLEAALAAARVPMPAQQQRRSAPTVTQIDFATNRPAQAASEFAPSLAPAVAPIRATGSDEPAKVWATAEVTFEERIAAKAFFGHGSIDEQSRNWLLG